MKVRINRKKLLWFLAGCLLLLPFAGCQEKPDISTEEPKITEEVEQPNLYDYTVMYQIPEGLESYLSGENYEVYSGMDGSHELWVEVWLWTEFESQEAWLLKRYSELRNDYAGNLDALPQKEVIGDYTVQYLCWNYTRDYEYEEMDYSMIYASAYLPQGILVEVEGKIAGSQKEFDFEKIRPFFENLEVQENTSLEKSVY